MRSTSWRNRGKEGKYLRMMSTRWWRIVSEAAATSLLSRRWRYFWSSTMTLNLEAVNFEDRKTLSYFYQLDDDIREQKGHEYVNWVNHVLEQHRGQSIERFRVIFFLDNDFTTSIDKWVQFAMEKRVQVLELDLLTAWGVSTTMTMDFPTHYWVWKRDLLRLTSFLAFQV
ncbi:F-box/FBD/LRR-repeat protein [Prunus yedoensis var. nudiflora]|uniref:F-box/FBD/LRR-repeat protein n=1 Tax=Prunus yedoensis var. nudiflora TaxID=2094558 RepID=A0A314XYP2_PRUYE|nr:F-box/FBD/LRR-repeat protein [Prunus yedoensis var. nudiflora]